MHLAPETRSFVLAVTLAALAIPAAAQGVSTKAAVAAAAPSAVAIEPQEVRAWLMRIHNAARQSNFQGTLVVNAAGGPVSSARIAHFCTGPHQFERIESLDGQARHMFRVDEVVHTVWPRNRIAVVEQRAAVNSFPSLLQAGDDRIAEFYDLRAEGSDRVAGHDASVLTLNPRDANRFGYRLWAEKNSGLLLRADVLGERGELLETSAFSEVSIGIKPQPDSVSLPMKKLDGYRIVRSAMTPANLDAEGWTMRQNVPGFRQVSCVSRPMALASKGDSPATSTQALQTIFSDGLTYVSVFIEPNIPERNMREALTANGATQTLRSRSGDYWVTVVGDVPVVTLKAFANGLERKK